MASLITKLQAFARSPQGKQMTAKARAYASDPANQAKLKSLGSRLTGKDKRK
ncbi:MAG: hypothetical protein WBQ44_23235 [Rhodococcus sp. (in: high G+C Gram-positive bacteria)]